MKNDEFIQYCIKKYKSPFFSLDDFKNDMSTVTNIKKMLSRYSTSNKINERLILNHVITLSNVFGIETTNIILFYKLDTDFYPAIISILQYLNIYKENHITCNMDKDDELYELLKNT